MERSAILGMLKTVFSTLTVAMRYEPANAKFFETQVKCLKIRINQIILFIHVFLFDADLNLFCTNVPIHVYPQKVNIQCVTVINYCYLL